MGYREMWLFRYTNEGAGGIRSGGFTARRDILSAGIEAAGGRIAEFAFIHGNDEWDAMMICEYPERPPAASLISGDFMARGAGTIAAERIVQLVAPEEVDEFVGAQGETTWKPAGS
jgi:uncharacterized protein with GYD domain